ncbi:MAG: hypothetical protein O3A46_15165 [Candidatus Poribacteria bacterium]|nr:hypothetical protein [Candidatus Poribacteria bacterium]
MRNVRTREFRGMYAQLPESIQRLADDKFRLFESDPSYPSLQFMKVESRDGHWKVRINRNYRAVCRRDGDTYVWYFIGKHAEFDARF